MSPRLIELRLGRHEVVAELRDRGATAWQARADFDGPADLAEVVASLVGMEGAPTGARLRILVAPPLLQVRRLETLPPVRDRQLCELIARDPARYFRKNGKPLVTDAAWTEGGRRVATAVALEEPYASALFAGAREAGHEVDDIVADLPGLPALSLLPTVERDGRRLVRARWIRRASLLAIALWIGLGLFRVVRSVREARALAAEYADLRPTVDAIFAARSEMDQAVAGVNAADAPVVERLARALTLAKIVSALPDSAWLTGASLHADGRGSLTGASPRPAVVLARIERTGAVPSPRQDGRSTSEILAGRRVERFTFRFGTQEAP